MHLVEIVATVFGFGAVFAVLVNGLLQFFLSDVNAPPAVALMIGSRRQTQSGHRQRRSYQCHEQNIFAFSSIL